MAKNDKLEQLFDQIRGLIEEAREDAKAELIATLQGATSPKRRSRKVTKSGKPRKNPWAGLTPEQKAERVRKMQEGRKKAKAS